MICGLGVYFPLKGSSGSQPIAVCVYARGLIRKSFAVVVSVMILIDTQYSSLALLLIYLSINISSTSIIVCM